MDDAGGEGRIRPWGSLTFRDFRLLWIGGVFSGLARYMREMLNFYLIYEISGSAVQLGLTGLFQAIPVLTLGLLSGSIADHVDRKKLLIVTHTVGLTAPFLLAFLIFADLVAVWHLWLLTSLSGAIAVVGGPAQRAFMARLVPRSHMMNAVTLLSFPMQGTLLVGPVLAGSIVDVSGIGYAYLANGMLQVASLGALVLISTSGVPEGDSGRRRVSIAAIVDGLRFTWQQKIIFAGFLIDYTAMAFGFYRILLPVLAKDVYGIGATGLGVLNAAPAIGAGDREPPAAGRRRRATQGRTLGDVWPGLCRIRGPAGSNTLVLAWPAGHSWPGADRYGELYAAPGADTAGGAR